jgi:DNA mismatch repair protein MutS2
MSVSSDSLDTGALEFDAVRALLVGKLVTPLGRTAVEALAPSRSVDEARARLAAVAALVAKVEAGSEPPLSGAVEVRSWLARFFAGEHALQARDAADLKRALRTAERCRRWCLASAEPLARFAAEAPDLEDLVEELEQIVDDRGEVLDSASAKLRELRREIERRRQRDGGRTRCGGGAPLPAGARAVLAPRATGASGQG